MIKFTLWGLYQYDPTLFNNAPVPSGIEKQVLIDTIMDNSGDLYCYYQQPERFKLSITNWFRRHELGFARMILALTKEYNPIENYDRHEDENTTPDIKREKIASGTDTNTLSGTDTNTLSGTDTNTLSGTDTNTLSGTDINTLGGKDSTQLSGTDTNTASGKDTVITDNKETTENIGKVSAFDSADFENKEHTDNIVDTDGNVETEYGRIDSTNYGRKDEITYGKTDSTTYGKTDSTTYGKTDSTTYGKIDSTTYGKTDSTTYGRQDTETEKGNTRRTLHAHGNIGTTTNAFMINEELELRKFDLYKTIAQMFEDDLLIQVY